MNVLLICSDIGKTAPGKVYKTIAKEFSLHDKLTVLTEESMVDSSVINQIIVPNKWNNRRIIKLFISIFGFNFLDYLWTLKCCSKIKHNQYDLIISCLSYHHYSALVCGNYISKKQNVKHICYSVDAVPAPEKWGEPLYYVNGVKRFVKKNLSKVDVFYSSNPKMLEYQKKLFNHKNIKTGVIYTPVESTKIINTKIINTKIVLLYTGSFYGARNPKYLFEAFKKLLIIYPNAVLRFIGTQFNPNFLVNYKNIMNNIEILPYQDDLNRHYNEATVLIDVDAEHEDDVFLSSKITNYIFVDKPILAETSFDSPSYRLFKDLNTIYVVDHNSENLYKTLKEILNRKNYDYSDRESIKSLFIINNHFYV